MDASFQEAQGSIAGYGGMSPLLEVDFTSGVSGDLFRTEGDVVLWSNTSLPYILIDAALWNSSQKIDVVRYMMTDVQPSVDRHFEIFKNRKISSGVYNVTLDISGPEGLIRSETRRCEEESGGFVEGRQQVEYIFVSHDEKTPFIVSDEDLEASVQRKIQANRPDATTVSENRSGPQNGSANEKDGSTNAVSGGLVGSTSSNKYHRPDCRFAVKIKPENRIYFANAEEAERQGYQPCKTCNPT